VPRRVKEHPEGRAGLMLVPDRAKFEHRRLGGVKIVDDDVEMPGTLRAIADDLRPDCAAADSACVVAV
jgi:hypothetical protein